VDLALAGHQYTREAVAIGLGIACLIESAALARACLRARRLTPAALIGDAVFGTVGLVVMSIATTGMPDRGGSLFWMLPYTVATAAGLGLLAGGDLVPTQASSSPTSLTARVRWWPALLVLVLATTYVLSQLLPHLGSKESLAEVGVLTANYAVFFFAAFVAKLFVQRRLAVIATRNAQVTVAVAEVAQAAQWRAITVDVFGPVMDLLDRLTQADDGRLPQPLIQEADRLISMIEAVRPLEAETGVP
jgi:hypothetical protein